MIRLLVLSIVLISLSSCNSKTTKISTTDSKTQTPVEKAVKIDTITIEEVAGAIEVTDSHEAPEMLRAIKPIYSMNMIDGEVEGFVKLRILVGTDGLIKKYVILNDLGFGTNKAIHEALLKTTFTSAKKNGKRIPVWIETTLNFKLPNINL